MKRISNEIGCSDNSCVFGSPGGMATNGGCYCLDHKVDRVRLRKGIRFLRATIEQLQHENTKLHVMLEDALTTLEKSDK